MTYVDGFVVPVPTKKLKAYRCDGTQGGQGVEGTRRDRLPANASPMTSSPENGRRSRKA